MSSSKILGYAATILAGFSFGVIPIISAIMRDIGISSIEQTFIRLFFGALVGLSIIIFNYIRKLDELQSSLNFDVQKTYILQGFLFTSMIFIYLSSISLKTQVGEAALLIQIHPLITLFLGNIFLEERITKIKVIAIVLSFIGLGIITQAWQTEFLETSFLGEILAASNGFLFAIYLLIGRSTVNKREKISFSISISWVLVWGFFTGIPIGIGLSFLPLPKNLGSISLNNFLNIEILLLGILLALFGSIISYGLIMFANKYNIESSQQSILVFGEPISAMVLGSIFLSEPISLEYIIGGVTLWIAMCLIILTSRNNSR